MAEENLPGGEKRKRVQWSRTKGWNLPSVKREQRVLVAEGGRRGCSRKGKRGNDSGGVVVFREREREEKSLLE